MSDEQRLAYLIGQDIATKAIMGFQIKKGQKNMIDSIKENTVAMVNLQKEMEKVEKQKAEQERQEAEYNLKKEKENIDKPNIVVTKRGRPAGTGSYRSK